MTASGLGIALTDFCGPLFELSTVQERVVKDTINPKVVGLAKCRRKDMA